MTVTGKGGPIYAGLAAERAAVVPIEETAFFVETDTPDLYAWDGAAWFLVSGGGGGAHSILDGVVHTDSALDTVSVGSLIYGNATPLWDELVIGTPRQLLQVNAAGTLPEWASNIDIPGTLDVTGAAVMDSTLGVTGLLTASGHIRMPASGQIQDSAGTAQLTVATASPQLVAANDLRVLGQFAVGDVITAGSLVRIGLPSSPAVSQRALDLAGSVTPTAQFDIFMFTGSPTLSVNSSDIGNFVGLSVAPAISNTTGTNRNVSGWFGINTQLRLSAGGAGWVNVAGDAAGIRIETPNKTNTVYALRQYGIWVKDQTISTSTSFGATNYYGIKIDAYTQLRSAGGAAYALYIESPTTSVTNRSVVVTGTAPGIFQPALLIGANAAPEAGYALELRDDFLLGAFFQELREMTAPVAPAANGCRLYSEDNGAGKTRIMALFSSGAAQQVAIEP